jgi:hypothetical protein
MDHTEITVPLLLHPLLRAQPSERIAQKTPLPSQSIGACWESVAQQRAQFTE